MYQITKIRGREQLYEDQHDVVKLLKWLPAGPVAGGEFREKDLVQFIARRGGIKTVAAEDLTLL